LAAISDPEERWAAIKDPPVDERTGKRRWTPETTRKRVGYHGPGPETAQEKVEAVHDLVVDEQVAAQVVTDLLRRPAVAFKAMTDDTATHQVNHAQVEQSPQPREAPEQQLESAAEPFEPTVRHRLGRLGLHGHPCGLGQVLPPRDDQDREQAQGRQGLRDLAESLGGGEVTVRHEALCLYPRLNREELGRRFLGQ
jgi:hypothetical protein